MQVLQSRHREAYRNISKNRRGVDSIGSWTGKGARGLGKDPRGPNCRRIFNSPDPLKAYNTWVPVEKACKAGVLDEDLHFSMSSEPNGLRVSQCLAAFEKHIVDCGMDGVFNIIKKESSMENSGTFKNIIIAILIAVAGYFSYSAYNAEDQLSLQTAEIKNLNGQIATLNQKVTDYEKADAEKKAVVSDLEEKVTAQSKDLEDLKAQLAKSVKPSKAKEAPKATKTK